MTVVEIVSGLGGSSPFLIAKQTAPRVTGIMVSPNRFRLPGSHGRPAGVADLVEFRELAYRQV